MKWPLFQISNNQKLVLLTVFALGYLIVSLFFPETAADPTFAVLP